MNFNTVTSRENPLIKLVVQLQNSAKSRSESGLFVLEGLRICKDAMENDIEFEKLIVNKTSVEKLENDIKAFYNNSKNCYCLPDDVFKKISNTSSPQGIIAVCKRNNITQHNVDTNGKYVILENLSDPSNLGAISRTSEALGISGLILSSNSCDPYSPKALRASMGTLLRMPIIIIDNLAEFITKSDINCYACVVNKNAALITKINFKDGCAIVIGNEANGLTDDVINACNKSVTIPMHGKAESLNAAAAAAIAIWEMSK